MKSNNGVKAAITLAVLLALTALGVFGCPPLGVPSISGMRTGIDIQGGLSVALEPVGVEPSLDQLTAAKAVIEGRLDAQNVFDRNVAVDPTSGRILVEIPYKSNEGGGLATNEFNAADTVVSYIGRTANMTFRPVDESTYDSSTGDYAMEDEVLLTGDHVQDAVGQVNAGAATQGATSPYVVDLRLDSEGATLFADATRRFHNERIAIWLDDEMIVAPIVNTIVTDGRAIITGQPTLDSAKMLAGQIKNGSMPFNLEPADLNQITPLLGEGALAVTVRAGLVAFLLVLVFMTIFYRLPGLVACVALAGMVAATLDFLAIGQVTLTLPGIAGIILSIGMSIDANVLISERIKEELRLGRTIKAAIEAGFRNAFSAILDSNITTLISAVVLYILGSGPIKGFAVTLALGVILSFLSAITVTRLFLRAVAGAKFARTPKMYGVKAV